MLTGYEVTEDDPRHVKMTVDGQIVLVRKEDGTINATQIVKLTHESPSEQNLRLIRLRRAKDYEIRFNGRTKNTWISSQDGKELCVELRLENKLRPLLNRASNLQRHQADTSIQEVLDRHAGSGKRRSPTKRSPNNPSATSPRERRPSAPGLSKIRASDAAEALSDRVDKVSPP